MSLGTTPGQRALVRRRTARALLTILLFALVVPLAPVGAEGPVQIVATFSSPPSTPLVEPAGGWWNTSSVVVTLACEPAVETCGIFYRVNDGDEPATDYTGPFTLSAEMAHNIHASIPQQQVSHDFFVGIDRTAPDVSLAQTCSNPGLDGWCRTNPTYTMGAAETEAASGLAPGSVVCSIDGRTADCSGSVTGEGVQTLRVSAQDVAGNTNATEATVRIDSTAPQSLSFSRRILPRMDDGLTRATFYFSEPMDHASTEAALVGATGWTRSWDPTGRWLNVTVVSPTEGETAIVTLGADALDAHGVPLGSSVSKRVQLRGLRDYEVTTIPLGFVNVTSNGTDTGMYCDDDCGTSAQIPFGFTYYGHTFYELNISPNGFVTFGNSDCLGDYTPDPFPDTCPNLVAAFWEDLDTRPGANPAHADRILTHTIGDAPQRVFLVSWSVVHHWPTTLPLATFQLQLHEGTNYVEIHYERALSDSGDHLIGIINGNHTRHTTYAFLPIDLVNMGLRFAGPGTQGDTTPPTVVVNGTQGIVQDPHALVTYTFSEPMDRAETLAALTGADGWTRSWSEDSRVLTIERTDLPRGSTTTLVLGTRAADLNGVRLQQADTRTIEFPASDTIPPPLTYTLSPPANAHGWHAANVTLTLASEQGATLAASIDGAPFVQDSTFALDGNQTARTYNVTLRATDAASNTATVGPFDVRVDIVAPTVSVSGTEGLINTSSATVLYRFSEPMHREATLAALQGAPGWTPIWSDDSQLLTLSRTDLPPGTTTLTLDTSATDAHGVRLLTGHTRTIVSDTAPPAITYTLTPPANAHGWHTANVTLTLESETGASLAASIDGAPFINASTFTLAGNDTARIYNVTLRATDAANNTATVGPFDINVDIVAPVVNATGDEGAVAQSHAHFNLTFSEPMDRASVESALSGTTNWTLTWNAEGSRLVVNRSGIPVGSHVFTLGTSARDAHGLPLAGGITRTLTHTPTPPPPPPPAPDPPEPPTGLALVLDGRTATLTWGAPTQDHGAAVTSYRVTLDGVVVQDSLATSYTSSPLSRGALHVFEVRAVNSAGASQPARATVGIPPVTTLAAPAPGANGWYRSAPVVELTADPADATILYDTGAGERTYNGTLTMPPGTTTLAWHARAGGQTEATRRETFRVDPDGPRIEFALLSTAALLPGEALDVSSRVTDPISGVARVEVVFTPRDGSAPLRFPLEPGADGSYTGRVAPPQGEHDARVVATDAAGNEASAPAGSVAVAQVETVDVEELPAEETGAPQAPGTDAGTGGGSQSGSSPGGDSGGGSGAPPEPSPTPTPTSEPTPQPLEQTSNEPPPPPPEIIIELPEGVDVPLGAGARGVITIRLTGVDDIPSVIVVLISELGEETTLSEGQEVTTWDTESVDDGFYFLEVRRLAPEPGPGELAVSAGEVTLASLRVLVRNPISTPVAVAGAVAGGVLVAATASAGLSAVSSGASSAAVSAGGGFDPFGFLKDVAVDATQDKLKDKTKNKAALDRRRKIRSWVAALVSLALLASLWAFAEADSRTARAWLVTLPLVGAAAAIVTFLKYSAESGLAYVTKAKPRIRLWVAGTISLFVSAVIFRNPFGYPGFVDETGESETRSTWRMQGLRALFAVAGAAAFMLPFLAVASVAPWGFVSVGMLIAVTNLATASMPFGPLPGKDVWRWNKWISIAVAFVGFAIYVGYAAALAPIWSLWLVAFAGAVTYAAGFVYLHKTLKAARAKRIPVATPIPVVDMTDEPKAKVAEAPKRARGRKK